RSFRELPEHGRAHPQMQRRLHEALPEIEAAATEARSFLVELSAADRLDLQRTIRDNPELLPQLARHMEQESIAAGIAPARCQQGGRQVEHRDRQFKRSSPGVTLDEYVARADAAAAEAGTVQELSQRLADRLGAPAYYTLQQRQQELASSWWLQPPVHGYP